MTNWNSALSVYVNGELKEVTNPNPMTSLADFLRNTCGLTGTKVSCGEGGCGSCTVVITNASGDHYSVNACLTPLCSVDGLAVTTVEGLGSVRRGLHPIQERIAAFYGSQCGYCTPGWVMQMYSLLKQEKNDDDNLTPEFIENNVDGNICRCTGYRPILDACKSFCKGACRNGSSNTGSSLITTDMEDLFSNSETSTVLSCPLDKLKSSPESLHFQYGESHYYTPTCVSDLESILSTNSVVNVVAGFTSVGVSKYYNDTGPYYHVTFDSKTTVDISKVQVYKSIETKGDNINVGCTVTLAKLSSHLRSLNNSWANASSDLISHIANHQVRNRATWAGNLVLHKQHKTFPSDLVLLLIALGVQLNIYYTCNKKRKQVGIEEFLASSSSERVEIIESMDIALDSSVKLFTEKVAPRSRNSHSIVTGVFLYKLDGENVMECRLVIGGVNIRPLRLSAVENILTSNPEGGYSSESTIKASQFAIEEAIVDAGATSYDKRTAKNLFFKSILSLSSSPAKMKSTRPVTMGNQSFEVNPETTPVSFPLPKLSSKIQASGEASYLPDYVAKLASAGGNSLLYGALIFSTVPYATLESIDTTTKVFGNTEIVDIITATDIPGSNFGHVFGDEMLMVPIGGVIKCVGATLGAVLAKTQQDAIFAASQVKVTYGKGPRRNGRAILSLDDAIKENNYFRPMNPMDESDSTDVPDPCAIQQGDPDKAFADFEKDDPSSSSKRLITGEVGRLGAGQKHFYMETQGSVACLSEEGNIVKIKASCQDIDMIQRTVSVALGKKCHEVDVEVHNRVGGGFGGKLTRAGINAGLSAVAAVKHAGKTIAILNDRNTDMQTVGGREVLKTKYKALYDVNTGKVEAVDMTFFADIGFSSDYSALLLQTVGLFGGVDNAYYIPNLRAVAHCYETNTVSATPVRTPIIPQMMLVMELIFEEMATKTVESLSFEKLRQSNFYQPGNPTPVPGVVISAEEADFNLNRIWDAVYKEVYEKKLQEVEEFNASSEYLKRGVAITPVKYGFSHRSRHDGAIVSIFANDGSVIVTHGGCEIGQGINVKAVQMAAHILGIPVELISIRPIASDKLPNSQYTGASCTSESVANAIKMACIALKTRLESYLKDAGGDWTKGVAAASGAGVQLFEAVQTQDPTRKVDELSAPPSFIDYFCCNATCAVVELDTLTGTVEVLSVDLTYDCGISFNPGVDIGQIEGGFVFGMGMYMMEDVIFDQQKGTLMNTGTWSYKVPMANDVPQIMNIKLLDNSNYKMGILNSKATGEPSMSSADSVYFAVKDAIRRSRKSDQSFFQLELPATKCKILALL